MGYVFYLTLNEREEKQPSRCPIQDSQRFPTVEDDEDDIPWFIMKESEDDLQRAELDLSSTIDFI